MAKRALAVAMGETRPIGGMKHLPAEATPCRVVAT